jgi:hypothetical protein
MRFKSVVVFIAVFAFCSVGLLSIAHADLYWEYEVTSGGVPQGIPDNLPEQIKKQMQAQFKPTTDITKHFLTANGHRTESKDSISIMDFNSLVMYQINPSEKSYVKIDLKTFADSKQGQMTKGMMGDMKVTATADTQTIAGYKCKKYIVSVMGMDNEHWVSTDVKGYDEFKKISKKLENIIEKYPALKQMSSSQMSADHGFIVKTVNNVMGMKSTTILKKIAPGKMTKNILEIPAGYQLKQIDFPFGKNQS